jgi:hypothetical protein
MKKFKQPLDRHQDAITLPLLCHKPSRYWRLFLERLVITWPLFSVHQWSVVPWMAQPSTLIFGD